MTEAAGELRFITPPEYCAMIDDAVVRKALDKIGAKAFRIKVTAGEGAAPPASSPNREGPNREGQDQTATRALSHPEVQRFQQMFPNSQVRQVRNLKE